MTRDVGIVIELDSAMRSSTGLISNKVHRQEEKVMRPAKPRIDPLEETRWDEQLQPLKEAMKTLGDGRIFNIFSTLAHNPRLLKNWMVFGTHVLSKSTLPARERELVILRIGWLCQAEYEWGQHVVIGKLCGLTDDEIARIPSGADAAGWSELDRLLLRASDELHHDSCISDATWKGLSAHYDKQQMLDLLFTAGQYTLVSMVLNSLGVELDPGLAGFPKK
jgi:alkylhydroperoxidase family enzyme